jgi:L-gulonolactone oxidase
MRNFGGNVAWSPRRRCRPSSEDEVLDILRRHAGGRIRAAGSGHSWSDIAVCPDVTIDMRRFDRVEVLTRGSETLVHAGAGCRLQRLLDELHARSERTLPTLGAVKRQTISGAISTGTHGSGRQSLSHFVAAVRLAAYDAKGTPRIFEYQAGDELWAARCGLGCVGVLLSVELRTVPKYRIEENVVRRLRMQDILSRYGEFPLTQFLLLPYRWDFLAFERRPAHGNASARDAVKALLLRLYQRIWVDLMVHGALKAALLAGSRAQKLFMKAAPRASLKYVARRDAAERVLTLGHHYFRHEEMELFVPQSRLAEAEEILRCATEVFSGEMPVVPKSLAAALQRAGLDEVLTASRGAYTHHYAFVFRQLLREETLVSMGCGAGEPLYSISVFTYLPPQRRQGYYRFCWFLATCMVRLVEARLHWGKHFPLGATEIAHGYPDLERFRQVCRRHDPNGVFRNAFTERVLGY